MEYWPVLETKTRKILLELVEPTVRRTNDHRVELDQLKASDDLHSRQIENQEAMIERINNRLTILDEFSRRLIQFESDLRIYDIKSENEREKIKEAAVLLTDRVTKSETDIESLFGKAECLRLDCQKIDQNLTQTRSALTETIDLNKEEIASEVKSNEDKRKDLELFAINTEKKLAAVTKDLAETDVISKHASQVATDSAQTLLKIENTLMGVKKDYKEQIDKIRSLTINYNRQANESFKRIKDKIFNEQPVENYSQITEVFYEVFNDLPTRKKIADAEAKILPKFEGLPLPEELKHRITEFSTRSEELVKVEPPEPKKKKKKFKISDLLSLDNKVKSQEEKMKSLEEKITTIEGSQQQSRINLNETSSESGSEDTQNNIESFRQNAEVLAQILGITDIVSDVEEIKQVICQSSSNISEAFNQLGQLNEASVKHDNEIIDINKALKELKDQDAGLLNNLNSLSNSLKETHSQLQSLSNKQKHDVQSIKLEISETQSSLLLKFSEMKAVLDKFIDDTSKTVQTLDYQVQQALYEVNSASIQRKRDFNDNNAEFAKINQHGKDLEEAQENHLKRLDDTQKHLSKITEFLRISVALNYQDEIDRDGIALIGHKDAKAKTKAGISNIRASVSLDKQCISCSGQINMITTAFKMACLAYAPSLVNYKDSSFQRIELLEIQRKMIEGIDGKKEDVAVERIRNSKTPKPNWRPVTSLSMCVPSVIAQTPDLPPISLLKRTNNYVQ